MNHFTEECSIITRHYIHLVLILTKFVFLLFISSVLYIFIYFYKEYVPHDIIHYVFFPIIFMIINYGFARLILGLISYYNKLFIIHQDKVILLNASLMLQDDFEIMDLHKVMKIDVECHGVFANMLGYGHLIIEQQKDEVRRLHYIPDPYKIVSVLREKLSYISPQQRK